MKRVVKYVGIGVLLCTIVVVVMTCIFMRALRHQVKTADPYDVASTLNSWFRPYIGDYGTPFFSPCSIPTLCDLPSSTHVIQSEFLQFCKQKRYDRIPTYSEVDKRQAFIRAANTGWKTLHLRIYGRDVVGAHLWFPQTFAALPPPHIAPHVFFSILDPDTHIEEHVGPYVGVLRYHLALEVPKQETGEASITVSGKKHTWTHVGQHILFDDTLTHCAQNTSHSDRRVVLFMDIERPLDKASYYTRCIQRIASKLGNWNDELHNQSAHVATLFT